ncbi:MAG: ABC transporter ATP-binding protein [Alphaproteobacteria bacterium]
MTGSAKFSLKGINKAFGSNVVLNGLDLEIMAGKSLVIIGGSGTGKSVTIKCMLGLLTQDSGSITFEGKPLTARERRDCDFFNRVGMLFQGAALFDSFPVWENVAFGLIQGQGMGRAKARDIAMEKLSRVGLGADVAELSPAELSGGMQKRVGLARAIATDPEVIFFDEPTTGLDPIMADVINELISGLVRDMGATAISITHDMASANKIADNIAMIHEGHIIWQGPVGTVNNSGNDYVDQFINGRAQGPIQMQVLKN